MVSQLANNILERLSDGNFHSGEELGEQFSVSRSAIWKAVKQLDQLGIRPFSVQGKGYCIQDGLQLLDPVKIKTNMSNNSLALLSELDILQAVGSTNQHLLDKLASGIDSGSVCLSEMQMQGRGRHGKPWQSPFGLNIYLSLYWRFEQGAAALAGLSLAVGTILAKLLKNYGLLDVKLKWPNDVMCHGKKIAGVLLELAGDAVGPCHVVIGVGLNIASTRLPTIKVDQPWTDMESQIKALPERNLIAAQLLENLLIMLPQFEQHGFSAFEKDWQANDGLYKQNVDVKLADRTLQGIALGVDEQGHILVQQQDGQVRAFSSADISVRMS